MTFDGSGLFDLSGMSSGTLNLVTGSTIVVNNSAELRVTASEFKTSTFGVDLNGTNTQLQFAQGGGGQFANAITGTGDLHLIGGTLQLTGINNTYSGGTVVELGSTLDLTTANVTSSGVAGAQNITDAGGLIVFDQDFVGTYSGVIGDGKQMGTGPMKPGSLDIDNSTNNSGSGVELTAAQAYSGATYVEAGTLTLDATNAIADSSGLTLGRVGGAIDGQTAGLQLLDNNTLASLSSDAGNSTSVVLNGNTLTLEPGTGISSTFRGTISDGSSGGGGVVIDGAGTVTFTGSNSYSGNTDVEDGTLVIDGTNGNSAITVENGATIGGTGTAGAVTVDSGGTFTPGDPSTFTVASLILQLRRRVRRRDRRHQPRHRRRGRIRSDRGR